MGERHVTTEDSPRPLHRDPRHWAGFVVSGPAIDDFRQGQYRSQSLRSAGDVPGWLALRAGA